MGATRNIDFDAKQLLTKLSNAGIKRAYLGNPTSIYYVGYTSQAISKCFKTEKINPVLLNRILNVIEYATNADLSRPTILTCIEQQRTIDILKASKKNQDRDFENQLQTLRSMLTHVSTDLLVYSDQFARASNFIKHSLDNLDEG